MKKLKPSLKPFKLDEVKEALQEVGVQGHYRDRSQGFRPSERGHTELYRGAEYVVDFLPKVMKIREIVIPGSRLEASIEAIKLRGRAASAGNGKIFILNVEKAIPHPYRNESGADAI